MICVSVGHGSKRHSLQSVELSRRLHTAVQIVSKPPAPSNGEPIYLFGQGGHADPLDNWRCSSEQSYMHGYCSVVFGTQVGVFSVVRVADGICYSLSSVVISV